MFFHHFYLTIFNLIWQVAQNITSQNSHSTNAMSCESVGCANVKVRASLLCHQFIPCQALHSKAQTQTVEKSQQTYLRLVVEGLRIIQMVQMLVQESKHLSRSTAGLTILFSKLTVRVVVFMAYSLHNFSSFFHFARVTVYFCLSAVWSMVFSELSLTPLADGLSSCDSTMLGQKKLPERWL